MLVTVPSGAADGFPIKISSTELPVIVEVKAWLSVGKLVLDVTWAWEGDPIWTVSMEPPDIVLE